MDYSFHDTEWTDEQIARFWQFYYKNRERVESCFSRDAGDAIVNLTDRLGFLSGKILDFGCGPGFLIGYLLQMKNCQVFGCDTSPGCLEIVRQNHGQHSNFGGVFQIPPYDSIRSQGPFDVIFLVEVIEHLKDPVLNSILEALPTLLSKNGRIVITTPNDQDLHKDRVCCPECGATFHRMQHLRSWTSESLTRYLERFGFQAEHCQTLNFFNRKPGFRKFLRRLIGFDEHPYQIFWIGRMNK